MAVITIPGTSGNDTLIVTPASPDSGSLIFDGATAGFSSATSFTFNGSTGSDVFRINNPTSGLFAPSGGITFNGGGQPGDVLENLGGAAFDEFYAPTSANAGSLNYATLEVQRLTTSGSSGTFTLTFNGQTTSALPVNATAAQVQAALGGLSSVASAGGIVVDQSGGQYTIFFTNWFSAADLPQITASAAGGTTASVATLANGGGHQISFTGSSALTDTVGPERPGTDSSLLIVAGVGKTTILDGTLVNGQQTTLVSSTTFAPIQFANKTSVDVHASGAGSIVLNNPHPEVGLRVLQIGTESGSISQESAADGTPNAAAPTIELGTNGGAIGTSASAPVEIDVSDAFSAFSNGGNIFVTDTTGEFPVQEVNAGTGNVVLTSLGSGLTSNAPNNNIADVIGNVVTLKTTGNNGEIGFFAVSGPQFFEVDAHVLNASTNNSTLLISDVAGGVAIGSVNAGTNSAFLRINGGTMTSASVDGIADIIADTVNLTTTGAGGSFGASTGSPLEIDARILKVATVSGPGSIHLRDTAALLGIQRAETVAGDITIEAAGSLAVLDITAGGGQISLQSGGDFIFKNGILHAAGAVTISIDTLNSDPGVGATAVVDGTITAQSITVNGNSDNDTITIGSAVTANITVNGAGGNDAITGGAGNDILDGGAGIDTASFSGPRSAYTLTNTANGLVVAGPDGIDTLKNIEFLAFSDTTIGAPVTPPHWIASSDIGAHPAGSLPTSTGDFNHDGTSDVLWFNSSTLDLDLWKIANGKWTGSVDIGAHPAGYEPSASGDFDGDGTTDVLWYNPANGDVDIWKIGNAQWAGSVSVGLHPLGSQPVGSGDFNGDGTSDVLWYNPINGDAEVWKLSNGQWAGSVDIGVHPLGYTPIGTGDFDHDGTSDVLWYNPTNRDIDLWKVSNGHWAGSVDIGTHPAGYVPVGIGEFNQDGTSDIVWFNATTGDTEVWLIANGHWSASVDLGTHPAGSSPAGIGDFDHNGTSDILWRETATNHVEAWLIANT